MSNCFHDTTIGSANNYEVLVIGGGHAGAEAAAAAARMGVRTLLITHNIETIGQMSCNPAIGGIGKGHLVREIDALGGIMARAADKCGIHWRVLNSSKGPAVRATRAQIDRNLYRATLRRTLEEQQNLDLFQSPVSELIIDNERVTGVCCPNGIKFYAPCVILTVGTFLAGKIHVGLNNYSGGRAGDPSASRLAAQLQTLPLQVARLKTGTPPRIDARSVDFARMLPQESEGAAAFFSYLGNGGDHPRQVDCHITHTNEKTHDIIRKYLDQSPMYTGVIAATGPRYCPSIEDKVMRFADKKQHQIFIEPESLSNRELYPNGVSTSLPFAAQVAYIQTINGLENARITRPGYAIEYDFFNPQDLHYHLESKKIANLFLAGQINGTTGYEEAAAQGLLAGINAALRIKQLDCWYPRRDEAYLGVLVDDLITQGTQEPYRMFTSRAEYRLLLREDNADARLTEIGYRLGCVDEARWQKYLYKRDSCQRERQRLRQLQITPQQYPPLKQNISAIELLKRPEINWQRLQQIIATPPPNLQNDVIEQIDILCKYQGYIQRQHEEAAKITRSYAQTIPASFDYLQVNGLSAEIAEKLQRVRPQNLQQAARIAGMTPAALSILLIYLKKHNVAKEAQIKKR